MDDLKNSTTASSSALENQSEPRQDPAVVLIYTTFPSLDEAKKAGKALVVARLAACVNIFPTMTSVYVWDGKVEESSETAMLIKTVQARRTEALDEIKRLHPYALPARHVLPVIGGGEDFLAWIAAQCAHYPPD